MEKGDKKVIGMKIKLLLATILFTLILFNGHTQEMAVIKQLINQVVPGHSDSFELKIIVSPQGQGQSLSQIYTHDGKIVLAGSADKEIAVAFNWYLKYYYNSAINSCRDQLIFPLQLPLPKDTLTIESPFQKKAIEERETIPVMHDLLYRMAWSKRLPDNDRWIIDYQISRYGESDVNAAVAWRILEQTIYNCDTLQGKCMGSVFCARPDLNLVNASILGSPRRNYDPVALAKALELLLKSSEKLGISDAYNYDVIDITRQILSNYARIKIEKVRMAFEQKDLAKFRVVSNEFLDLMKDLDILLATRKEFMLGPWIESARDKGNNKEERKLFEIDARTLITKWSNHENLEVRKDDVNIEWSGLITDFYLPRWEMYFKELARQIIGTPEKKIDYNLWEQQWSRRQNNFATRPNGNSLATAVLLFQKYKQLVIR